MTIPVSDPAAAVRDIAEWDNWARSSLQEPFREHTDYWKLYLSSRRDHRKAWEKTWRSHTLQPYPYIIAEGKTAAVADTVCAADELVQCEGIGDEDVDVARKVERLLGMTLRQNQWRLRAEGIIREMTIQGTAAIKTVWRHDVARVRQSDPQAEANFDSELAAAKKLGIEVPEDPNDYEAFRKSEEGQALPLPQHPRYQYQQVTTFRGPSFERVAISDLRFDPMEEDWTKQRRIGQVIVKPMKWVRDRAGDDPSLPFIRAEVDHWIEAVAGDPFNEWITKIAEMMGVGVASTGYWGRKDLCVLMEVWDIEDEEMPYKVLLNPLNGGGGIINKDPFSPYGHGECPVSLFRNVPIPGHALGLSEFKAPRKLFEELWALRDLRLDAVTLASMPIFTKLQELGIPEISRILRPGTTIPLARMDALKKLDLGSVHPDTWREISELKSEIDDSSSVTTQLRGQPASVGRVSASESERRFSSAMLRMKTAAVRFEEELRRPIRQSVWLWYEKGEPEELVRIGGQGTDAYIATVTKQELLRALDYDFNFRGASRATNKEMATQQAFQWFATFGALIPQHRQLAFAAQTYDLLGLKQRNQVLPDADIQMAIQAAMMPPPAPPAVDPATGQPLPPAPAPAPANDAGLGPGQLMPPDPTVTGEMPPGGAYASPGEAVMLAGMAA